MSHKHILLVFLSLFVSVSFAQTPALVRNTSKPYALSGGLEGRHLALWHSHGRYYELANARWEWQRARMFQTVEDRFPATFVLPYLVPMLENAGAVVLLPRERDVNPHASVADNDKMLCTGSYSEKDGKHKWKKGRGHGFGQPRETLSDGENPFETGTFHETETVADAQDAGSVTWRPDFKDTQRVAVYVSYHSTSHSTTDAQYTVRHQGGETHFSLNQRMNGGTWVYLGTFTFAPNGEDGVTLTSLSSDPGKTLTADAVRFGGGMGNVARQADGTKIYDNTKKKKDKSSFTKRPSDQVFEIPATVSGDPRWLEGARYYLQFAGMPKSVYSSSNYTNDYTDDYKSRGLWVNYLKDKLSVPLELSFAFHTDAGTYPGDKIVGTLGICNTKTLKTSRAYCETICNSILNDVRAQICPQWNSRGIWDRDYNECTVPTVPSMILELLSHENFADMRYGHDPKFQFTVSRAIYKGMLRYVAQRRGFTPIVQPLPVDSMAARLQDDGTAVLTWRAVEDALETTAHADSFIVYTRRGKGDFDNGVVVREPRFQCPVKAGEILSFRVGALNGGGESMPSEILAVGRAENATSPKVLVINAFDRLSGPDAFVTSDDSQAGFLGETDNGCANGTLLSYIGPQREYRRSMPWTDDDAPGFGDSRATWEKTVCVGNTFDYPALHGESLMKSGCSFESVSAAAADSLSSGYPVVDLILGKQKSLSPALQENIASYCRQGGAMLVSGAYVGSKIDKKFTGDVLKVTLRDECAATNGDVAYVASPLSKGGEHVSYRHQPGPDGYAVESPDAVISTEATGATVLRYGENGLSAAVVFPGTAKSPWRTAVSAVPLESVADDAARHGLFQKLLNYLLKK